MDPSLEILVPRNALISTSVRNVGNPEVTSKTTVCRNELPVIPLTYNNPARPRREHLQQRTCSRALYQACPPPSSAQEMRARGRSGSGCWYIIEWDSYWDRLFLIHISTSSGTEYDASLQFGCVRPVIRRDILASTSRR
jgi:hypothetical protein